MATISYLILAFIFSYGILLIYQENLASVNPRYIYSFGFFVVIILISSIQKNAIQVVRYFSGTLVSIFSFYLLSFPFVYASALNYQYESFKVQAMEVNQIVTPYLENQRRIIVTNWMAKTSPIVKNSEINFPILKDLIPRNESLYWPNVQLFQNLTQKKVEFKNVLEDNTFKKEIEVPVESNDYYDLYLTDKNIYLLHK